MSDEKKSILPNVKVNVDVSTKDIAPVAQSLLDKISNAIGIIYGPTKARRAAKAVVDAVNILDAIDTNKLSPIQQRTVVNMIGEHTKQQENIERITYDSSDFLNDSAKPEDIEDDWISDFFSKARHISDDEMSVLWSKILAGEANEPGTYPKRVLSTIYEMSKSDAEIFTKLCRYVVHIGGPIPFITDIQNQIYTKEIRFVDLQHLDGIGLISFNNIGSFQQLNLPDKFVINYGSLPILLEKKADKPNNISVGHCVFTQTGERLFKLTEAKMLTEFAKYLVEHLNGGNYDARIITAPKP